MVVSVLNFASLKAWLHPTCFFVLRKKMMAKTHPLTWNRFPGSCKHSTDTCFTSFLMLLLTWSGHCSSVGSHITQTHDWCQRLSASTLSAVWEQWPQLGAGTGQQQRAGSLQETSLGLPGYPAECGPVKEDDYQMLEYVVDGVTIERFYDSLQSTHSKLVIIVNAAFKAFLDHLFLYAVYVSGFCKVSTFEFWLLLISGSTTDLI